MTGQPSGCWNILFRGPGPLLCPLLAPALSH